MLFAPISTWPRHTLIRWRIASWRCNRRRRCFTAWSTLLIPDQRLRAAVGQQLRTRIPILARFARQYLGMIFFDRLLMPKFTRDISELRTCGMDIRQVLCDAPIRALIDTSNEHHNGPLIATVGNLRCISKVSIKE